MRLWPRTAQSSVALVLCNGNATNIRDNKITTGYAHLGLHVFFTQLLSGHECKLAWGKIGRSAELISKQPRNIFLALVHGWCNNMVRRFFVELLNVFSKIGLYTFNFMLRQKFIQMDLFCHHALALHQRPAVFFLADAKDLVQRLVCIFSPDHFRSSLRNL